MGDLKETTKLEIEHFEGKLQGIRTILGNIQAYSKYIIASLEEKTLAELKYMGRDELTVALIDLKDKVAALEKEYYEAYLSLRYEIVKNERGVECIRLLD
ncbi:hypothetical protein ACH173_002316 [Escherichia coli]|nr:hypothetical protein [Escherichia coli]